MSVTRTLDQLYRPRSLRFTMLLALGLGFLLLAVSQYLIAGIFLRQQLQEREIADAFGRLDGLQRAVALVADDLQSSASDWSNWDDSYDYVQTRNPDFIATNVDPQSLTRLRLNLFVMLDERGDVAHASVQPEPLAPLAPAPEDLVERLSRDPLLLPRNTSFTGLVTSSQGVYLVSSFPVHSSQPSSPAKGRLIMGRLISAVVPTIARITTVDVDLLAPGVDTTLDGAAVHRRGVHTLHAVDDDHLEVYTQLHGPHGETAAVLHAVIKRQLQGTLTHAQHWLLALTVLIALLCCVLSILYIERKVVRPITGLARQLEAVAEAPDTLPRVEPMDTAAELTVLSYSINDMLSRIEAEQHLRREHDAVVRANQLKSEFLATMSHEIRTPMNGVLGMCELLQRTELDARQRRLADTILRSGRALLCMLNDVLDYSKIEAGKIELVPAEFVIAELIESVAATFGAEAQKKHLLLHAEIAADVPTRAIGDQQRLRQVLLNLVSNAIKFTHAGKVQISCTVEDFGAEYVGLRFDVSDSGVGIPLSAQARIFEPFVQAHHGDRQAQGGTGLGLAIARRLVLAMGGEISLHSRPDTGSTFSFTVELERAASQVAHEQEAAMATGMRFANAASPRILLVEDNAVNREVMCSMLEQMNCTVTAVENGAQAVEACTHSVYDMVMMDCEMPVMDGHAATREIRDIERALCRPEVPIVAVTANVTSANQQRCFESGMSVFITKPVSQARLTLLLTQLFRGASRNGQLAS
ncbi:MAG TPA: ATP-binding protein [Steroidobacteraceae bacterium]|nr:ATP-binding protein [Steroidobacteraceae bacterium]